MPHQQLHCLVFADVSFVFSKIVQTQRSKQPEGCRQLYLFMKQQKSVFHLLRFVALYGLTLTHNQTTFVNIVTNGEIAKIEQFFLMQQGFPLCPKIILLFLEIFHMFVRIVSKPSDAGLLYVGNWV